MYTKFIASIYIRILRHAYDRRYTCYTGIEEQNRTEQSCMNSRATQQDGNDDGFHSGRMVVVTIPIPNLYLAAGI